MEYVILSVFTVLLLIGLTVAYAKLLGRRSEEDNIRAIERSALGYVMDLNETDHLDSLPSREEMIQGLTFEQERLGHEARVLVGHLRILRPSLGAVPPDTVSEALAQFHTSVAKRQTPREAAEKLNESMMFFHGFAASERLSIDLRRDILVWEESLAMWADVAEYLHNTRYTEN